MRQVARVENVNGSADAYDARGVMLLRQRCDKLVGYGPEGFVVMRGNCYWGSQGEWLQRHVSDDFLQLREEEMGYARFVSARHVLKRRL